MNAGSNNENSLILRHAVREVLLHLNAVVTDLDPAPWCEVSDDEVQAWAEDDPKGFIRRKKIERRAICTVQSALLSGALPSYFRDGYETANVPGWAWQNVSIYQSYWFDSHLPMDPFLPDEWYRWSGHDILVDRDLLNAWLTQANLSDFHMQPILPTPFDEAAKPEQITKRLPRDAMYVTLSEALSWIAFGISMDRNRLTLALEGWGIDRVKSLAAISAATAKLTDLGTGGKISFRGKYVREYLVDDTIVETTLIDPLKLADFAQFDCLADALTFGHGVAGSNDESIFEKIMSGRDDAFRNVSVCRADLLLNFPEQAPVLRAMLTSSTINAPVLPSDDAIKAKMLELKASGFGRDDAAKHIKTISGFEAVGNEHARRAAAGAFILGRPRKRPA